ncbi:MAG: YbbR-like domain-containing protein [Blastocatellia bacterium]
MPTRNRKISFSVKGMKLLLRGFATENLGLKVIALFLALVSYGVSRQPVTEVTLVGVPLEYRGLREGLELSGEVPQTVNVRLRGPRDLVRGAGASAFGVVADLAAREPGERMIQLTPAAVTAPDNIEVLRVDPPGIRLAIEQTQQKTVSLEPVFLGAPMPGYERGAWSLEPAVIGIAGPQSRISGVTRVRTEGISLDGRAQSFEILVEPDFHDRHVRMTSAGAIRVRVGIAPKKQ